MKSKKGIMIKHLGGPQFMPISYMVFNPMFAPVTGFMRAAHEAAEAAKAAGWDKLTEEEQAAAIKMAETTVINLADAIKLTLGKRPAKSFSDWAEENKELKVDKTILQVDSTGYVVCMIDVDIVDSSNLTITFDPDFQSHLDLLQEEHRVWLGKLGSQPVDLQMRLRRFVEEVAELTQAAGLDFPTFIKVAADSYSRPEGEVHQELGGTMVTLLCLANVLNLSAWAEGTREFNRINTPEMIEKIAAKQKVKSGEGHLMAWHDYNQRELEITEEALTEAVRAVDKLAQWKQQQLAHRDAKDGPLGPQERRAAAKRATLDATKAFAKFRRPVL